MLSRKYYKALAEMIRQNGNHEGFIVDLIEFLKKDNPRFDETKFLEACDMC